MNGFMETLIAFYFFAGLWFDGNRRRNLPVGLQRPECRMRRTTFAGRKGQAGELGGGWLHC